jgi:hypothetical protein
VEADIDRTVIAVTVPLDVHIAELNPREISRIKLNSKRAVLRASNGIKRKAILKVDLRQVSANNETFRQRRNDPIMVYVILKEDSKANPRRVRRFARQINRKIVAEDFVVRTKLDGTWITATVTDLATVTIETNYLRTTSPTTVASTTTTVTPTTVSIATATDATTSSTTSINDSDIESGSGRESESGSWDWEWV